MQNLLVYKLINQYGSNFFKTSDNIFWNSMLIIKWIWKISCCTPDEIYILMAEQHPNWKKKKKSLSRVNDEPYLQTYLTPLSKLWYKFSLYYTMKGISKQTH